jgi:hypothetical protein
MLGDFPLSVTLDGERYDVVARDVPAAVFFYGFPDVALVAGTPWRLDLAVERWTIEMLPRVISAPRLTLELVHRLGEGALDAAIGYQHTVGWITEGELLQEIERGQALGQAAARYLASRGAAGGQQLPDPVDARLEDVRVLSTPPAAVLRRMLVDLARALATRPSTLWQAPISTLLLDWRLITGGVLQPLDQEAPGGD